MDSTQFNILQLAASLFRFVSRSLLLEFGNTYLEFGDRIMIICSFVALAWNYYFYLREMISSPFAIFRAA
jgi:hypothetical protein